MWLLTMQALEVTLQRLQILPLNLGIKQCQLILLAFLLCKNQIPIMLKQGGGVILNTSSIAGIRGLPNATAYSASKHAVIGITKTVAMEYAKII